jgi:hypothetical protein
MSLLRPPHLRLGVFAVYSLGAFIMELGACALVSQVPYIHLLFVLRFFSSLSFFALCFAYAVRLSLGFPCFLFLLLHYDN